MGSFRFPYLEFSSFNLLGTGKSLFQTVWMRVFKGEDQPTLTGITEAVAYEQLANGDNIYGTVKNPD